MINLYLKDRQVFRTQTIYKIMHQGEYIGTLYDNLSESPKRFAFMLNLFAHGNYKGSAATIGEIKALIKQQYVEMLTYYNKEVSLVSDFIRDNRHKIPVEKIKFNDHPSTPIYCRVITPSVYHYCNLKAYFTLEEYMILMALNEGEYTGFQFFETLVPRIYAMSGGLHKSNALVNWSASFGVKRLGSYASYHIKDMKND